MERTISPTGKQKMKQNSGKEICFYHVLCLLTLSNSWFLMVALWEAGKQEDIFVKKNIIAKPELLTIKYFGEFLKNK